MALRLVIPPTKFPSVTPSLPATKRTPPSTATKPTTANSQFRPRLTTNACLHPAWIRSTTPHQQTKNPSPVEDDHPRNPSPTENDLAPLKKSLSGMTPKVFLPRKKIPLWPRRTLPQVLPLQLRDDALTKVSSQNTAAKDLTTSSTTRATVLNVACSRTTLMTRQPCVPIANVTFTDPACVLSANVTATFYTASIVVLY